MLQIAVALMFWQLLIGVCIGHLAVTGFYCYFAEI